MFEAKITIGNILEILTIAVGGLMFLWQLKTQLTILQINQDLFKDQLEKLEEGFKELTKATSVMSIQSERLNSQSSRMDNIEKRLLVVAENMTNITNLVANLATPRTRSGKPFLVKGKSAE